ncbi:Wzz/FepE/Etk N-terminal domain-containing protein [Methylobacterium sp. A54F]
MSRIGQSPVAERASEGLALPQMLAVLRRSWAWIAVPTVLAGAAAVAFVQVVPPRYTGEAKVLLESREAAFTRTAAERGEQAAPIDEQAVASQVQVAMSRDLAREAIRRLKLVGNPEFDPSAGEPGPAKRVLMMLGLGRNPLDRPAEDRVLESYFERLLVYPAGKSRILTVEFRSRDPELAAQGANTVSELYLASLETAKTDTARYASTWLGGNIEGLRKRVAEAEARVETFRAKHGLIGGSPSQPLTGQQLGELSSQLSQARTLRADLAGRVKAIKEMIKDGRAFEIGEVANNDLIRRTVESRIALKAQLALESRTLLPAHPRIKELTAQVSDLDQQIKAAAERIVRTLDNDAKIAGARVDSLQAAVDGQSDVVAKGNTSEIQLRALEREARVQRDQLESYLSRFREAAARDAEGAAPADARIVSRAVTPETPSFPKKVPTIAFATLVALLLSAGAVLGRHLLAEPPRPDRVEPRLGPVPDEGAAQPLPERRVFAFPEAAPPNAWARMAGFTYENNLTAMAAYRRPIADAQTEATATAAESRPEASPAAPPAPRPAPGFDLDPLIARLGEAPRRNAGTTLLIVETAAPRGGQDFVTSLAEALAARGGALLVDLDGPLDDEPGLTDLVAGEADFPEVIRAARGSRLHRVSTGLVETDVLFGESQALGIAVDAMAEAYAWVVCRLRAGTDHDLLALAASHVDSVVIATNAAADDPALVALYGLVERAGTGQVLVAQDHHTAPDADALPLRRSAA